MEKEYWFVIFSGILSGGIIFGGALLSSIGLSPYEITFFHSLTSVILLLPLTLFNKKYRPKVDYVKILIIFALINSLLGVSQFVPAKLGVPVSITVLLLYTQPIWTTIFSKIFLDEKITKIKILAILLALIGIVFIINPFQLKKIGSVPGIITGLIAGILLSGWIIFGRVSSKKEINPITTKFGIDLFTIFFLIAFFPITKLLIKDPSIVSLSFIQNTRNYFYLLLFGSFAGIAPHLLYFKGVKKVTSSDAGIILLLEPVSASILAAIFLGQSLTLNVIIGGILILVSNYLAIREKG